MKTAGIVTDNYKVDKFKKELVSEGLTDFMVYPFLKNTSTIKVKIPEAEFTSIAKKIQRIIRRVEFHFKHSN